MAMVKVIRTLTPENGMDFMDILSFETESYIGLWDYVNNHFIATNKCERELRIFTVLGDTLTELDEYMFKHFEEHIIGVSDRSDYRITLHPDN